MPNKKIFYSNFVQILQKEIYPAEIVVEDGIIVSVKKTQKEVRGYIMPGFIDAHVHIESSMLVPVVFAKMAVVHGTVATVSDPHEIANVMGKEGVEYMIENGEKVNFKFYFGAPSCVPATPFETAGASLSTAEVAALMQSPEIKYLAEMMNWPGVLNQDKDVMLKIAAALEAGKPVDGHAPGLKGNDAAKYGLAGITTDHECFTKEEALDKIKAGMKIIIREGSAAKNFEALHSLVDEFPEMVMFCSDDKHPDDLLKGHINELVSRSLTKGLNIFNVLRAACINPVSHYNLEVGQLKPGDPADFIVVKNLTDFTIEQTYINGELVAENGKSKIPYIKSKIINNFNCSLKCPSEFEIKANGKTNIKVIVPSDGQLVTETITEEAKIETGLVNANLKKDTLKLTVVNRYKDTPPAMAFIKNFGLTRGAIASCVGHDSHNIIAVGVDDESICSAVNEIIKNKGGICAIDNATKVVLPLPVAGIMAIEDGAEVSAAYSKADKLAKAMGCQLKAPFMTLSFMALLVIPSLKLSDKGLFDGSKFEFTALLC